MYFKIYKFLKYYYVFKQTGLVRWAQIHELILATQVYIKLLLILIK